MANLPTAVEYPVVAIGDLHGRRAWLAALADRLRTLPEWPAVSLVFLGDFGDRGDDVRGGLDLVLTLIAGCPGSTAVMGNHDLALTRAAGLDGLPPSAYWQRRYGADYDHLPTFASYLGREPDRSTPAAWAAELAALRDAMPAAHRDFLAGLPWLVRAPGHAFLHCGLSQHLDCTADAQLELLRRKVWDRAAVSPKFGSTLDTYFDPEYPAWLGADRTASRDPLPIPGVVQVTGHQHTRRPDASPVRIRLDTTGGMHPPLTACLLTTADALPVFVTAAG